MFSTLGLFKSVDCPEQDNCNLPNCIFNHSHKTAISTLTPVAPAHQSKNDSTPKNEVVHLAKRRRLDASAREPEVMAKTNKQTITPHPNSPQDLPKKLSSISKPVSPPPVKRQTVSVSNDTKLVAQKERTNLVEPPKNNALSDATSSQPIVAQRRKFKEESMNPRHIAKPPATHPVRVAILRKLHESMVKQNDDLRKQAGVDKRLLLSPNELIVMAVEEEERAAKTNPLLYQNNIRLRIVKLGKMPKSEWEVTVKTFLGLNTVPSEKGIEKGPKPTETGMAPVEEILVLSKLVASKGDLQKAGFVLQAPNEEEITKAKKGAESAKGWEQCDRCSSRFQVFPGRREDGILSTGGRCTYHYAKPFFPAQQKTDKIVGQKEPYYPCCNESIGASSGCTTADSHVFKVSEVKRLAAILQFEETPDHNNDDKRSLPPVCFDCEMGYTTLGLELIRLTAVSWPDGSPVLDILVRPLGEILDFNTRFSGVSAEHFANAIPHRTKEPPPKPKRGLNSKSTIHTSEWLPIVDSPAAARALLFHYIHPSTPLIGHAIDNDLNACRIIHPTIVDTVFLYPHPRGLPMRFALRTLAQRHLERHIQVGGGISGQGHDSLEDAVATGDLVRVKVGEKWKAMKRTGWKIENGKLVDQKTGMTVD